MGMINPEDKGQDKWLYEHAEALRRHAALLSKLSPDGDGRLHSVIVNLEQAADVLLHWQDPQVMLKRAEELEAKTWYELRMYEEQNLAAIRAPDVNTHLINLTSHIRRKAKERHLRAEENLRRLEQPQK